MFRECHEIKQKIVVIAFAKIIEGFFPKHQTERKYLPIEVLPLLQLSIRSKRLVSVCWYIV